MLNVMICPRTKVPFMLRPPLLVYELMISLCDGFCAHSGFKHRNPGCRLLKGNQPILDHVEVLTTE